MNTEKNNIRAFFAIDLPDEIKALISESIKPLHSAYKRGAISWVKFENLHITLQFIEAVDHDDIALLIERVREKLVLIKPFPLSLTTLELFPTPDRPHIISLNIMPHEALSALAECLRQGIKSCGYPVESRPFRGHLTLGRIKDDRLKIELEKVSLPSFPEFSVREVVLYRSELAREGSNYFPLATFSLQEN